MNKHAEWLEERRSGIGGSDAAAILGLSPWKTALETYMDKRGEGEPTPENEAMRWGKLLESVIRQEYADVTGRTVRVPNKILRHPEHDFLLGNVDGLVSSEKIFDRIFEAKNTRSSAGWGEPGTDEIPRTYLLQVQHYMMVTGLPVADVAVLIGGSDFRLYEVERDEELLKMLLDAEREFWDRVKTGRPPEPVSYNDMLLRYGRKSKAVTVEADVDALEAVGWLKDIRNQRKALDEKENTWKAVVLRALGEADTLTIDDEILCTWKAGKAPVRFNTKGFKVDHPELYKEYKTVGEPSRRFLLKGGTND